MCVIFERLYLQKFQKLWGILKIKLQNNWLSMIASYITALFSKILFSKSLADDFQKISIQKLLHIWYYMHAHVYTHKYASTYIYTYVCAYNVSVYIIICVSVTGSYFQSQVQSQNQPQDQQENSVQSKPSCNKTSTARAYNEWCNFWEWVSSVCHRAQIPVTIRTWSPSFYITSTTVPTNKKVSLWRFWVFESSWQRQFWKGSVYHYTCIMSFMYLLIMIGVPCALDKHRGLLCHQVSKERRGARGWWCWVYAGWASCAHPWRQSSIPYTSPFCIPNRGVSKCVD